MDYLGKYGKITPQQANERFGMITDMTAHQKAGRRVLLARVEAGLSQRALADKSGVDQSTIVRVERGETNIRPMTLAKLAKALGMPTEELLG